MFKCLRGAAPAYLADYCTSTSLVPGRSALRSAAHGDIVVPSHRTDWGLKSFAVAGPSSWNALPVSLRSSSFSLDMFAKHLKTHLFGVAYSRQARTFEFVLYFVGCDTVTVSPNQIIILLKKVVIEPNVMLECVVVYPSFVFGRHAWWRWRCRRGS